MQIVHDFPPIYDQIVEVFPCARQDGVVFCFGTRLYNPSNASVPPQVLAHEAVHAERQGSSVLDWWRRYLGDDGFRFAEELPAHVAEYRWFLKHGNRSDRRSAHYLVAERLASPLYGSLVGRGQAASMLRAGRYGSQPAPEWELIS